MLTKLYEGVYAIDLCCYLPASKTLVIADLHIGYEESLRKHGVLLPRTQYKNMIRRLEWIFSKVAVERVVLNGDVKHEFGTISPQEWRDVLRLLDFFAEKKVDVIVVKGNHDPVLSPVAKKRSIVEHKELQIGNIVIAHGDNIPSLAPITLIGHEHPAILLREGATAEKFKCFAVTKIRGRTIIVQPSFNTLTSGTDIATEPLHSPLLSSAKKFTLFVVNDKTHQILPFGEHARVNPQL